MSKFATTRFRETVTYIQNYAASGLPAHLRNDIATMINTRYPRASAAQRQTYDQLSESMSVKGHIAPGIATGTSAEREQRRAIVLLWAALGSTQPVPADVNDRLNQGMTLAPAALGGALNDAMKKASVVASNMGALRVFTEFTANPLAFIQQNKIFIHGSTAGKATFMNPAAANFQNPVNFETIASLPG